MNLNVTNFSYLYFNFSVGTQVVSSLWVLSPTRSTRRYQLVKRILVSWRKNGNRIPVSWTLRSFLNTLVLWRTFLSLPCNHLSWDLIRFLELAQVGRCNSFSGLIQDQPLPENCPVFRNLQMKLENRVEPWIQRIFYLLRVPGKILNFNPVKQFLSWIKICNPSIQHKKLGAIWLQKNSYAGHKFLQIPVFTQWNTFRKFVKSRILFYQCFKLFTPIYVKTNYCRSQFENKLKTF